MTTRSTIAILALFLLGACSSGWSTRVEIGPKGSFAYDGAAGQMRVENHGPGTVDLTAERDDGHVLFETPLDDDSHCELRLDAGEKLKIQNNSDQPANIRMEFEED